MHAGTSSRMKKGETKGWILSKSVPGNFYFYFIYQNNVTWTSVMKIGLKGASYFVPVFIEDGIRNKKGSCNVC